MGLTSQAVNAKKVMSVKILKSFAGKKKEGLRRQNPEDPLQKRILRNVVAQTLKLLFKSSAKSLQNSSSPLDCFKLS